MKKIISLLLAFLMITLMIPATAEGYTPAEPKTDAAAEEYDGEWICKYASIRKELFETESRLEDLGMYQPLTMKFKDGMAGFTGIKEMEQGETPFAMSEGTMVFEPEEGVKVFILTMLQDGVVALSYGMIEGAPTLYLFRVEAEEPAA